jgi:hypothetical protein
VSNYAASMFPRKRCRVLTLLSPGILLQESLPCAPPPSSPPPFFLCGCRLQLPRLRLSPPRTQQARTVTRSPAAMAFGFSSRRGPDKQVPLSTAFCDASRTNFVWLSLRSNFSCPGVQYKSKRRKNNCQTPYIHLYQLLPTNPNSCPPQFVHDLSTLSFGVVHAAWPRRPEAHSRVSYTVCMPDSTHSRSY